MSFSRSLKNARTSPALTGDSSLPPAEARLPTLFRARHFCVVGYTQPTEENGGGRVKKKTQQLYGTQLQTKESACVSPVKRLLQRPVVESRLDWTTRSAWDESAGGKPLTPCHECVQLSPWFDNDVRTYILFPRRLSGGVQAI